VAGGIQQAGKEKKEIKTEEKKDKELYNLEDNISASRFERRKLNVIFYIFYICINILLQ